MTISTHLQEDSVEEQTELLSRATALLRILVGLVAVAILSATSACGSSSEITIPDGCQACMPPFDNSLSLAEKQKLLNESRCSITDASLNKGVCVDCRFDKHCDSGRKCIEQKCVCGDDSGCSQGFHCYNGQCVQCFTDTHCNKQFKDRPYCEPQENKCVECKNGQFRKCPDGLPANCQGTQQCVGGIWRQCKNIPKGQKEICNGRDDDCDGQVDNIKNSMEPLKRDCYTGEAGTEGVGICKKGWNNCTSGEWGKECFGQVLSKKETCNGRDDDCDGEVDEEFPKRGQPCKVMGQKGECANGKYTRCVKGIPECIAPGPQKETCDGKDNNCDGTVDGGDLCGAGKKCVNGKCE